MALSLVLEAFKKRQRAQGRAGAQARTSAQQPSAPGFARGTMGVTGARALQRRDVDAGLKKEMSMMQSPVFQAYVMQLGRNLVR